ncbi:hypothetical protein [Microbacterium lacticum]|uniref:hypothetical protein n=1 Tax=Microbacterium lacticum TaxID=33885 RepID=UPI0028D00B39|nr:hypothetical protein [Microbacterium lacticum]
MAVAVITPASFTVDAAGTAISVTVTNTLQPDEPVTPVEPEHRCSRGFPARAARCRGGRSRSAVCSSWATRRR